MRGVHLVEVNSELGAGTRGASMGVDAMRVAANNNDSNYFKAHICETIKNENQLLLEDVTTPFAKRASGIVTVYNRICDKVSELLVEDRATPIVLAGDHSTAGGTIAGIKKAYPNKRLGVIWIDAHADLHTPYTTPSGNVHGMPLATALGIDNQEEAINEVKDQTLEYWEALKNTGGSLGKIKAEDILFIGVRDTESPEEAVMERYNIKNILVNEVRTKGAEQIAADGLEYLNDCDIIYVSFDVDSMDPEVVSRGTGTPVADGITPAEAETLINQLLKDDKVCCFEVVEVNPCLDNKCNKMAETAFDILEKATAIIVNRNEVRTVIGE
jgi:arginase